MQSLSQQIYCGAIVKIQPCPLRRELINIGVLVVAPDRFQWGLLLASEPPPALQYLTPDVTGVYGKLCGILHHEILRHQQIAYTLNPMQNKAALDEIIRPREQMLQFSSAWTLQSCADISRVLEKEYMEHVSAPFPGHIQLNTPSGC